MEYKYYKLGVIDHVAWSEDRIQQKGGLIVQGKVEAMKKAGLFKKAWLYTKGDRIPLFDRNTQQFSYFEVVEKCISECAYICRKKGRVSSYWKKEIPEIKYIPASV